MSYQINLAQTTEQNESFRRVLFTGKKSQLVVMHIPPTGEVGEEMHERVEQTLYFLSGEGEAILNGEKYPIRSGDVIVVSPGTRHNFKNTGQLPLKIFTTYSPPNHIDGRIHATKADADADIEDEEFGHNAA